MSYLYLNVTKDIECYFSTIKKYFYFFIVAIIFFLHNSLINKTKRRLRRSCRQPLQAILVLLKNIKNIRGGTSMTHNGLSRKRPKRLLNSINVNVIIINVIIILLLSTFRVQGQTGNTNQAPVAHMSPTSLQVVATGSTIQLDGSGSSDPESQNLFYEWSFVEKPSFSIASFTHPSPSRPSFQVDQAGLYVVQLKVNDGSLLSEPQFLVVSAVPAAGAGILGATDYLTSLSCALSGGVLGCEEETHSFTTTAGNYILNITTHSVKGVSLILNSQPISLPSRVLGSGSHSVSIPVTLLAANILKVKAQGSVGSSVNVEIVDPANPVDNNSTPVVSDLVLVAADSSRMATGPLSISDSDTGQTHSSNLLNFSENGVSTLIGNLFSCVSFPGFKGLETSYVLTRDNGVPQKAVVSKVTVDVTFNTAPRLLTSHQVFSVPKESSSFKVKLLPATDLEDDSLTYSLVQNPSHGTLSNCLGKTDALFCRYTPPLGFTGNVSFTYKASDGTLDSEVSTVTLRVISTTSFITQVALGDEHSCVLFNEGNIRCWGYNYYGQLGLGHRSNIGDNEHPLSQGDVSVGERVLKLALGDRFTCALLESGNVKCWGHDDLGSLGLGHTVHMYDQLPSSQGNIEFGTTASVVDIDVGGYHACALFETGQMKCWGHNYYGQLGYSHRHNLGDGETLDEVGFVDVGGRVTAFSLGSVHTCALLESGDVKCWGHNNWGQLGLGHTNDIGDDERPSSVASINLGGQALEITSGDSFSCVRLTTGQVKCWGLNSFGTLGLGRSGHIGDNETPDSIGPISLGSTVSQISSGSRSSCALLSGGHVRCWGHNDYGQLGLGHRDPVGYNDVPSTRRVLDLPEKAVQVAMGGHHGCALLQSGRLTCWGQNDRGQLGLAHRSQIGDDETLGSLSGVVVGGDLSTIHPRFSITPIDSRAPATLTFDASQSFARRAIASYSWDFGNGDTASGKTTMASFTIPKSYNVRLTITDELGQMVSIEKRVTIQPSSDPPLMPHNQMFTLEQDRVSLLTLLPATDRENNALTYHFVNNPSQGSLVDCLNNNGDLSCKYIPSTGFTGKVTFSYRANDGTLNSLNSTEVELHIVPRTPSIVQLSSNYEHSCALFENKKIKCWGRNTYGQLGLGHTHHIGDNESVASQDFVNVGANVLQVSTGFNHTCALLENKKVKCWGNGGGGRLGPEHNNNSVSNPLSIDALDLGFPVKQIASGNDFNCALGESGQVKCWGNNSFGQLGYGHHEHLGDSPEEVPSRIPFVNIGAAVKKLSLGWGYTCALLEDKTLKCWGRNSFGQLGLGHTQNIGDNEHPFTVEALSLGQDILDVDVNNHHACALLADKNVKCWGHNGSGQLGLGHQSPIGDNELPSSVAALDFTEDVKQIFVGNKHTCALLENHTVKCWGSSGHGILGHFFYRNVTHIAHTRAIDLGEKIVGMSLGTYQTCVMLQSGGLNCFGENSSGKLGLGHQQNIGDNEFISRRNSSVFPEQGNTIIARFESMVSPMDSKEIAFDASSSFARNSIKSYQWDFGDGFTATTVNSTHTFSQTGSFNVTLTVTDNLDQTAMVSRIVEIENDNKSPYFEGVQKLTLEGGKVHTIYLNHALDYDSASLIYSLVQAPSQGVLSGCLNVTDDLICSYQAPSNFTGEVEFSYKANDGTSDSEVRVVTLRIIENPSSILQVSSKGGHTCALYKNKKLKCWGYNNYGQLGLGHIQNIGDNEALVFLDFVDVGAHVLQVAAGSSHTCVLLGDRSVKCWGYNRYGQLGLGHQSYVGDNELPSSISPLNLSEPIQQVVAGRDFSCALTESGKVKCWGTNYYGQLGLSHTNYIGDEQSETSDTFASVNLGSRAVKIASGFTHTCALLKEGRVRCWGYNNYGELGYGHREIIGDNEYPFLSGNVSVGQKVLDIGLGRDHTCTLLEDKSVKCWGYRSYIGPGHGQHIGDNELPSSIESIHLGLAVKSLQVGGDFSCALMVNGELKCWGGYGYGYDQASLIGNTVANISLDRDIFGVFLGDRSTYVVFKDGSVKFWGFNKYGQLGLGHIRHIGDNEPIEFGGEPILGGTGSPLIARFTHDFDTRVSNAINFDASGSYSSSSISNYSWNFGDGSATQTGQTVSHTFAGSGTYTVTLTMTDSSNQIDTFSQTLRIQMPNRPPFFTHPSESFMVYQNETNVLGLMAAQDSDQGTSLTYTLVDAPARGTLSNCLGGTADLTCDYIPDSSSTEDVQFTYKANDGVLDSEEVFTVFLDVEPPRSPIIQVSSGTHHTCVLFQDKKVSCWGRNNFGQLGFGHTQNIGDDETVFARNFLQMNKYQQINKYDFVDVGENVLQISAGGNHTCALLESGGIKCWGGEYSWATGFTP